MALKNIQKNVIEKKAYASLYTYNNTTECECNTADVWHSYVGATSGYLSGWSFSAGSIGTISAFADYSGTVAGTVKATTSSAHGLTTGAIIAITGTTNYNGLFEITVIDSTNFYFTDTWVTNDGTGNWTEGSYLQCGAGAAGKYELTWHLASMAIVNNTTLKIAISINTTIQERGFSERKFGTSNDIGNMAGTAILDIAVGDKIIMNIQNVGGTGNSVIKHMNINLIKCD